MSGHALDVLEFERVLERVARRASCELGRERVLALRPSHDGEDVVRELARVDATMRFVAERPDWGLGVVPDVVDALDQLGTQGTILEPAALHAIGILLATSRLLRAELQAREGRYEELESIASILVDLGSTEEAIVRSVDKDGTVLDTASRELKRIRDRLRGAHTKIVRKLEGYLASLSERYVVPDASVTIRDGRYVVPVRREGKGEVGGIVHGESQTGATLYVEPPVAIELMNGLRDLEGEEARELRRILRELTGALAPHRDAMRGALDALVEFDALHARARAALAWRAAVPRIADADAAVLDIKEGRHPLLVDATEDVVVPFDLGLGPDERALVVSGPNTGGKSVFLKATGLICALTQSGVVPPVGPGTTLPIFTSFFADIGDEQSIARNLSTFSAHLANLADIVTEADPRSLVLIDEMGTGTDPAEGAALARAVIEELVARGATTLVTSHLGELKRLDTEGSGVVNASLQFDSERMEPTYRLVKGRPGRSYGLAIARRLGFPEAVLDRAEAYRASGEADLDDVLARLEREEAKVKELAHSLDLERAQTARLREDLEARERSLREAERTSDERAREDARKLLLEARSEVEEAIRDLRGAAEEGEALEDASREARRRVEKAAGRLRKPPRRSRSPEAPPEGLTAGASVRIQSTGSTGRVVEMRADRALVEAGAMRLEIPVSDLEPVSEPHAEKKSRGGWSGPAPERALVEVDLRGMRVEEMERELTRALDQAILGDLGELRIIHGKGTGALRQRASEILDGDPRVREFRMGKPGEGGAGVTIASF